jgi:Spy/CpxP family protein refolding chaperone
MLRHADVTWSNPKVLATLAVIFLCGAAVGAAVTRGVIHSHMPPARSAPTIEQARHLGLGTLKAKLNLSPTQEQVITKILDDYAKFYQNIEDEREDVASVGKQRILETLTPEQRQRFNDLLSSAAAH